MYKFTKSTLIKTSIYVSDFNVQKKKNKHAFDVYVRLR